MFGTIMTCERPGGVSYLAETRASLSVAGIKATAIVTDGPTEQDPDGVRCGIVPTFRRAVAICRRLNNNGPVIVFQDDVSTEADIPLLTLLMEGEGVHSLYLSEGRKAPDGWSTIDDDGQYPLNVGACGFVMDAETAKRLLDAPPFPRVDRLGSQLVQWCWREKIPFRVHSPSILIHRGAVSCRT